MQSAVIESPSRRTPALLDGRCVHRATWVVEMSTRRIVRVDCAVCASSAGARPPAPPVQRKAG